MSSLSSTTTSSSKTPKDVKPIDHSAIRSLSSVVNYDNIKQFTKFPEGIELPAPVTKAMIDKINQTGSFSSAGGATNVNFGNVGVQLVPGFTVYANSKSNSAVDDSPVLSNTHMSIYHPDQSVARSVENVYDIKERSKMKKEYREEYFKQYGHFHRPHIFEVLIDNHTLQPIPIPTTTTAKTKSKTIHSIKL